MTPFGTKCIGVGRFRILGGPRSRILGGPRSRILGGLRGAKFPVGIQHRNDVDAT